MATWDVREWLSGLVGTGEGELSVRSIDRYGSSETQVRYERDGQAIARVTVNGPVRGMLVPEGQGIWAVKAQIGSGTTEVYDVEVPETDEIVY